MNRADRRRLARKDRTQPFKEAFKSFLVGNDTVDTSKATFCWLHRLNLENPQHPTDRDKRVIDSIRLKPFKTIAKDGSVSMGRSCPRCGNIVMVKPTIPNPEQSLSGYTVEPKLDTMGI